MNWKPIQPDEFFEFLRSSVAELTPETRTLYKHYELLPEATPCRRGEDIETVYIVARRGKSVVFFDDVEDEFAVGEPGLDGVLAHWALCGTLDTALRVLMEKSTEC